MGFGVARLPLNAWIMPKRRQQLCAEENVSKDKENISFVGVELLAISPTLKKEFEALPLLISLTLTDCGLATLDNFPRLPHLVFLALNNNRLDGSAPTQLTHLHNLQCLDLSCNRIEIAESLAPLRQLPDLIQLSLRGNPLHATSGYRAEVFGLIPSLQLLDNLDSDGESFEYSTSEIEEQIPDLHAEPQGSDEEERSSDEYPSGLSELISELSPGESSPQSSSSENISLEAEAQEESPVGGGNPPRDFSSNVPGHSRGQADSEEGEGQVMPKSKRPKEE